MLPLRHLSGNRRNPFGPLLFGATALALSCGLTEFAEAKVYPFAYLGGATIKTVREDRDELLNVNEIKSWRQGWSAGGGLRLLAAQEGAIADERPRWEIRVKLEASGGELEDIRVEFTRDRPPVYDVLTVDTFDYSGWAVGGMALARVLPQVGFFAGPSIQRIKLTGSRNRTWEGTVPDFCGSTCGDFKGDAEATVIYGTFEVGTRLETDRTPAALEIFWIPKRIQMSSTQTVDNGGYRAVFAELSSSVGVRLTYDF